MVIKNRPWEGLVCIRGVARQEVGVAFCTGLAALGEFIKAGNGVVACRFTHNAFLFRNLSKCASDSSSGAYSS